MSIMPSGGAATAAVPRLPDLAGAEPQVQAAIRRAHDGVRALPESAEQWGSYARVLDAHAFIAEAADAYRDAGRLDPADFRWPYLLAVLLSSEDPVGSLSNLRRALELNDGFAPLHLRYAAAMESAGLAEAALASYRRAVALDDTSPVAHAGLGRRLLEDGDAQQAKRHLDRAVELDARCRPALSALAAYHRRNGDMTEARTWAQRASDAPVPRSRDELLAAVRRLGVSTTQIIRRANELQDAGYPERGRQELQSLLRQNPASVRGHKRLGEFYLAADDLVNAAAQYRAALTVSGGYVPARLGLGHALTRAGRLEEARHEYETVLGAHPSSVPAHRGLAICLAAQGHLEQAAEHFARVIELAPNDRRARLACGSAWLGTGQYGRAAAVLDVLVTGNRVDDELVPQARHALAAALSGLARSHAAKGDAGTAASQLARAVTLAGKTTEGRAELALQYARSAAALGQRGLQAAAIGLLREGLARLPASARINNDLAWMLATAPDPDLRNGAEAVEFARRAVELTGGDSCNELDTLAAAYAEAGRYDEAITTAERALEIARRTGNGDLVTQLTDRLRQLKSRRPSP